MGADTAAPYFFTFFGSFPAHFNERATHGRTVSELPRHSSGIMTYSFIGLPFIGSNNAAFFLLRNSARSSSERRTNMPLPNRPMNMFPFTKAAWLPNIGLTVTEGSSGRTEWKNFFEPSSGRG